MKNPLLTICLLTHNGEKFIEKTLKSILGQTEPNFEILVSDNYSTDKTEQIIRLFQKANQKIIYRKNEKPLSSDQDYIGCYHNYNTCIESELIRGEFVAFCHDDDIYKNDIFKKELEFLMKNPEAGVVFTVGNIINENDEIIGNFKLPKELKKIKIYNFIEIFKALLKYGNTFILTPTFMAKREVFEKVGMFNENEFRTSADLEMWLRIAKKYPIGILDEKLVNWRTGGGGKKYQRICTKRADFFKVMDYYLEDKSYLNKVDKKSLRQYEYQKSFDDTFRAMNFLIKGEEEKAKEIINKKATFEDFRAFFENINIRKIKGVILRIVLIVGINLGLGKYLGRLLYKLRYS